jgi:hypothetical protein
VRGISRLGEKLLGFQEGLRSMGGSYEYLFLTLSNYVRIILLVEVTLFYVEI